MRSSLFLGLVAFAVATCQRVEEPAPAKPAVTTLATAATSTAPPATTSTIAADAGRCVVPLLDPPPPPATKAPECPSDPLAEPPVLRRGSVSFPEAPNQPSVGVEIAETPATEQRGLMYRTELAQDSGMIFVWSRNSRRSFWMRNTCIPLDMLFIAKDGTIAGILEQVPVLNETPRSVACPVAYVLEVNAGWTRRHGVVPGMKANITL